MSFRTIASTLNEARNLIADPAHWTQHTGARTEEGYEIGPTCAEARRFCLVGAVSHVTGGKAYLFDPALKALRDALPVECGTLVQFNDTQPHSEILALFDKAIALTKQPTEDF